jgi:hypothetical protein
VGRVLFSDYLALDRLFVLGINGEGYRHSVGKEIAEIESTPMKVKVTTLD